MIGKIVSGRNGIRVMEILKAIAVMTVVILIALIPSRKKMNNNTKEAKRK